MSKEKYTPTVAQALAESFSGADLLVSAGAGSGKTSTLTKRIIKKLIEGEDISRKLVVTFTKDATNELKARISDELSKVLLENPNNRHIGEQIVRLGSADICTIDSFCLKIVRGSFERLDLDGGFRMADESETEVLCKEAMGEVIDTFYEEKGDDPSFLMVCDCFSGFSNEEKLKAELLSLYKKLVTTKNSIETLLQNEKASDDFFDTVHGQALRAHALSVCDHYIGFFEKALGEIEENEQAELAFGVAFRGDLAFATELRRALDTMRYDQIAPIIEKYVPNGLGNTKKVTDINAPLFKDIRDAFKMAIRKELAGYFSVSRGAIDTAFERNTAMCKALYTVLKAFENEYQRKKRLASLCDFNDLSRYAIKLLYDENGEITTLAREIADKYDEVYVDEYQDTNYIQDRIFYAISKGNRFLVGDIKQSIYGFRSAEPEIFSKYRREFTPLNGCEIQNSKFEIENDNSAPQNTQRSADACDMNITPPSALRPPPSALRIPHSALCTPHSAPQNTGFQISMSENFRCDEGVINLSNAISGFTFGMSSSIPYDEGDLLKFSKRGCDYESDIPEIYVIEKRTDEAEKDDEVASAEAEFVADKIGDLIKSGYLANGSKIQAGDITILLRSYKNPVENYVSALQKRNIPCSFKGDEHFFEKSEILLALCILNAIDNPLREVYLAGAMRSVVFGFSLEEMAKIRKTTREADGFYNAVKAFDDGTELTERVKEFLQRLQKYRVACRKLSSHEALSFIYTETSLMSNASASQRRNLLRLYDIARSYESGRYKGIYGFLRYVEGIKEGSGKEELGSGEENSVRIMSVHGSKGLQFPVCFVCGCGARLSSKDASKPMLFDRELGVNAYVSREDGLVKFDTILRKCTQIAMKKSYVEEEMRMLYVATTRAQSKLIITGAVTDAKEFVRNLADAKKYASAYSVLTSKSWLEWVASSACDTPYAQIITSTDEKEQKKEIEADNDEISEQISEQIATSREQIEAELRRRFEFEYAHSHLEKIPSKLSVSDLKDDALDKEETDDNLEFDDLPSFVASTEKEADAKERGIATHTFLQFCDFELLEKTGAREELDRLVKEAFLSKRNGELVNIAHIEAFIKSELFQMIKNAKNILREFRFNMMWKTDNLTKREELFGNEILVQGICDCIIETKEGEIILVDYKTDDVTEQSYKRVLTERHEKQLAYYRQALGEMYQKPISKAIIYSIPLAKCVEIVSREQLC